MTTVGTNMFGKLSKDMVTEIFSFDNTYKDMYVKIVQDMFDNEEVRALKSFLEYHIDFPMMLFSEWLSLKPFMYGKERYYEVTYPTSTILFHIMPIERKEKLDDPMDPQSPKILKNMLWKLPVDFLCGFVNSTIQTLKKMKQSITDIYEYNELVSCMLHAKDYEDLVYHLQVHGKYEEEIHEFLFKELVRERIGYKMYMDDEQNTNYNYVWYEDKHYMVMWYEY